jgi:hypothetical protein
MQDGQRVGLVDVPPVRAELPAALADHGDVPAGPAQYSIFHEGQTSQRKNRPLPGRYMHTAAATATAAQARTSNPVACTTNTA